MIHQLQPYHANLKKRQVKSSKIYVRDSGLLHQLLGIDSMKSLLLRRCWRLIAYPAGANFWNGIQRRQSAL